MTTHIGLVPDLDEQAYHAHPALSQSGAKLLLDCPARFRWEMDNRTDAKQHFDIGHAVHTQILGTGSEVATVDLASRNSKAWREHETAARADGKVPLLESEKADIEAMAAAILDHDEARALLERDGLAEQSMFWTEDAQIGWDTTEVACRGRVDWLTTQDGTPLAVDLKTTAKSTAPIGWRSTVLDYGYDVQAAAYSRGHEAITGQPLPMAHIVVEKRAPWVVAVYPPMPTEYLERGERRWLDAVDLFAHCTATNTWPARPGLTAYPPLPAWAS